ncbi:CheR family methyltransferase, partial [Acidimangrovimonas sediminis]|uniref:CheR family methyltransferase n=1 Tax=Acidimangrovimonas sediminis TaxID=2056283 RepID=UPI002FCE3514
TDPEAYRDRLERGPGEADALFGDLLINVTRFFRDAAHFRALRDEAIAPLIATAIPDQDLRIWVPGCSSGEEAYSIAMLCADEIERTGRELKVQIFATDIDERMLEIARAARYPLSALSDVPDALREAYTLGREGSFQLTAQLRD